MTETSGQEVNGGVSCTCTSYSCYVLGVSFGVNRLPHGLHVCHLIAPCDTPHVHECHLTFSIEKAHLLPSQTKETFSV